MTPTSSGIRANIRLHFGPWRSGRIIARHLLRTRQGRDLRRIITLEVTPNRGDRIVMELTPNSAIALANEIADQLESDPTPFHPRERSPRDAH